MSEENVTKPFYKKTWFIALVAVVVLGALLIDGDDDEEEASIDTEPDTEEQTEEVDNETVELSQESIDDVTEFILEDAQVSDVHIEKDDEEMRINIAIIIGAATSEDHAKDLADSAVRQLASQSSGANPTNDYLGELWDVYDLSIALGTGADNIMWQGAKVTSSPNIAW